MVTLAIALMLCGQTFTVHAPALPEPDATVPAEPEPTPEPAPEPEPTPELTPEPEPTPSVSASSSAAVDPIDIPERRRDRGRGSAEDDGSPVERAKAGMWGMQFTFGGLAPLSIAGVDNHGVNRLLFTELGFRRVFDRIIIPFSVGAGVFHHNPDNGSSQNDAGLAATFGVLVPFRVWRRISPYAGGQVHFHYLDPTGVNNWLVNFSLGPVIGIEFYIAHRVSLLLQGQAQVGINVFDGLTQVSAATSIAAGGQMGLIFYF